MQSASATPDRRHYTQSPRCVLSPSGAHISCSMSGHVGGADTRWETDPAQSPSRSLVGAGVLCRAKDGSVVTLGWGTASNGACQSSSTT